MQAAANWLLECDHTELLRLQEAWHEEQHQAEQQRLQVEYDRRMAKKLIVDK